MTSRDYTKEIGLSTGDKNVPWPLALPVLALIAAGVGFGLVEIHALGFHPKTPAKVSGPALPATATHAVASR